MPTLSGQNTTEWIIESLDASQVDRYIIECECSVRGIIIAQKYLSINVNGGTGRVAISVSCYGGLGQLYTVKVWAVRGNSISQHPAVEMVNIGQHA